MTPERRGSRSTDPGEDRPIHRAARDGDISALIELLERGPDQLNAPGWMGNTPLHEAASRGHTSAVRLLIERGADATAVRRYAITPLHWARNADIALLLLDAGALPDAPDEHGSTPLHEAAKIGDVGVMDRLLERRVRVDAQSKWGGTPLHVAAKKGHVGCARRLLAAGADVNVTEPTWGTTPLHQAISAADEAMVGFLLERGAAVDIRNHLGQSAIHLARERRQWRLLDLLSRAAPAVQPATPTERDIAARAIGAHPTRPEALTTARNGILARWLLDGSRPRLICATQTDHSRLPALAVAVPGDAVEVRAWDDLRLLRTIALPAEDSGPAGVEVGAIARSPDGRWLAVADTRERLYLVDWATGDAHAAVAAGQRGNAAAFDPSSRILATACSFQGGAHVRIDAVTDEGELTQIDELERSDVGTHPRHFVDTLADVAFSPSGRWLGLFETSAIYHEYRPPGWRGDLLVYAGAKGTPHWRASVDAAVTGDGRSLREVGHGMGYFTRLLFLGDDRVLCGAAGGTLLAFRTADGELIRTWRLPTTSSIVDLAVSAEGAIWLVLGDGQVIAIPPADV